MKLTNHIRNSFVRAVVADLPRIKYDEQARERIQNDALNRLPLKVRALYNTVDLRDYLLLTRVRVPGEWNHGNSLYVNVYGMADYKIGDGMTSVMLELAKRMQEQEQTRKTLQACLASAASAVTTRKALADMLPEFERYLPADEAAACKTLPAVANLVASFAKAGWPTKVKVEKFTT